MKKISFKIAVAIVLCSVIIAGMIAAISIKSSSASITKLSNQNLVLTSEKASKEMDGIMQLVVDKVDDLTNTISSTLQTDQAKADPQYLKQYLSEYTPVTIKTAETAGVNIDAYMFLDSSFSTGSFLENIVAIKNDKGAIEAVSMEISPDAIKENKDNAYDWFILPISAMKGVWGEPYEDPQLKMKLITYSAPIIIDGKAVGVAGMDIEFGSFSEIVNAVKPYKGSTAFLVNEDNNFLVHSTYKQTDNLGSVNNKQYQSLVDALKKNKSGYFVNQGNTIGLHLE